MDKQLINDYVLVLIDVAREAREPGTDLGELVGRTVQTIQEMHGPEPPLNPNALQGEVSNYVHCVETAGTFRAGNLDRQLERQLTRSGLYKFMTNRFVASATVFAGLSAATFAAFEASQFTSHFNSSPHSVLDWPKLVCEYSHLFWTSNFIEQGFSYYDWRSVVPPMLIPASAGVLIAYFSKGIKNLFDWKERALKRRTEMDTIHYATELAERIRYNDLLEPNTTSIDRTEKVRKIRTDTIS